jgi:hypothetical protein
VIFQIPKSLYAPLICHSVEIVVVLLSQTVIDEIVEASAGGNSHTFHHLLAQAPLETSDILGLSVHIVMRITRQVVESM